MATASLTNYRQSPRKVRVVANLVRGKRASEALSILAFAGKKATAPLAKLIESAIANARQQGNSVENLFVKEIRVDQGIVLKRRMPRARGSAAPIYKRSSHVIVVLDEKAGTKPVIKEEKTTKKAKTAKVAKKTTKAPAKA